MSNMPRSLGGSRPLSRRRLQFEPLESRTLLAVDVLVRFEFVDALSGSTLDSLRVGEDVELQAYVQDIRSPAGGLFKAYFDVEFNASLLSVTGAIEHGPQYSVLVLGETSYDNSGLPDGLIDQAGGVTDGIPSPADDSFLLFSVPFHVDAVGTLGLTPSYDANVNRRVEYFDTLDTVPFSSIDFDGTSIEIISSGIDVTPTSGLTTTEAGGTSTFDVTLLTQPTANVTIGLSSNDTTEGTVSPASLTFTPDNWNVSRTVTVTGQDDAVDDGNVTYTIVTAPAVSSDSDYSGLNADDVAVTNTDNDTAAITVNPSSTLETTEAGGIDTFTIVLASQPTANVIVNLASDDTTEGVPSSSSVVFTPSNWNTSQTITVTGQNDAVDDGDITYTIVTTATSSDSKYNGISVADVPVINRDNDTAAIVVDPSSGLETTEAGGTDTFEIVLGSQPTADVTVNLASNDTSEGTLLSSSVVFTSANWNTPQIVTVTGQDDAVDDDDIAYKIVTTATSSDSKYNGISVADVAAVNRNNDTAGIDVTPTTGLETNEAGVTDTFQIVLRSQPTANVTIGVSSNDTSEGTVSSGSIVFTSSNWSTPQTVTVTGQDDDVDDDDVSYTIVTDAASSSDSKYNGMSVANISAVNHDDDTAGITVLPTSGLETTEAGDTDTFEIVLTSEPTTNVTIGLSSTNSDEGTISSTSVVFTSTNWNTPKTITVTGQDDDVDDGDIQYTIVTAGAVSSDSKYSGMAVADVSAVNLDDDTAGIAVSPTFGLETTEAGETAVFTIVLTSQPTANVTIGLVSNDTSEGTVSSASVVFTPSNWDTPQAVMVTGQDDAIDDNDISYSIITADAVSSDSNYDGMDVADVSLVNRDNDAAGITVTPSSGLETTEAGGSDTFQIVLTSQPTENVTIGLTSSDPDEGTASTASVVFTPANWSTPQTVTVTGHDDFIDDGDTPFTIVTADAESSDANYNGLAVDDVTVINIDDDTAGVLATPSSGLETTEAGHSDTFGIVLTSQPTEDVTIGLTSSDPNEGTVAPTSLTFTAANWNIPQTVTVTGQDDAAQDGDVTYSIILAAATSSDSVYDGLDPDDVTVVNQDNDIPGFFVLPTTGLQTTESGETASFEVSLRMQPTAEVTIDLSSSDSSEGTISHTSLLFTSENWATPQIVQVEGQDDAIDDDDISYTIILDPAVSDDPNYNELDPDDVSLVNIDDDTAGVSVSPTAGLETTEDGGEDTFEIVLTSEPTADVTIALASSDTTEGILSVANVVFTPADWNTPRTITITGQDDAVDDGDVGYTIVVAAAASDDPKYDGMDVDDVAVMNRNDDTAGIDVSPVSGLETTEAGGTATFEIVLTSEPIANVTIGLASDTTDEGTLSAASVVFTPGNWNTPQTITITGQDDDVDDGDIAYSVLTAAATSNDSTYDGMNAADVSVVNRDNDAAGISVVPTSGLETTEAGGTDTFQVVLNSQPTANVTVGLASSDATEGTVSAADLVFTPSNWNVPQTVTVTGQDDFVDDDDTDYTIVTTATSSDPKYNDLIVTDVLVINRDNDTAGISISPTSGLETTEAGTTDTFQIVLASQPTANVTIGLTSSDTSEGTISSASVVFTPSNWDTPQTLTVTGVDDFVDDDDVGYTIITAAATSSDVKYAGTNIDDVSVVNRNDDTAGITVSPSSGLVTTEAGADATFQLVLASQPTADVTIDLASNDTSEGIISHGTLTFSATNWNTPQTVTITGQDDFVDDDDVQYTIVTVAAASDDAKYAEMDVDDVSVVNQNNDTAGVVISPSSGLVTTEAGGTDTFEIKLASQPLADVTLSLASSDTSEGTLSAATVTFDSTNWNTPQTITITGLDDASVDGNVDYAIATTATSDDGKYDGLDVADVAVSNHDNDSAVLTLSSVVGSVDEGASGTVELVFQVTLSGAVEGGFHVAYTTDDDTATTADGDYADNDGSLAFTGADGETKTITVTVSGDNQVELDEFLQVALGDLSEISASAADRISVEGSPASGEIRNDDTTTLTISNVSHAEGTGGTASDFTFSIVLGNPVQGGFRVSYATADGTAASGSDYDTETGTLDFDGSAGETKTVTVQVLHDAVVERDEVFSLALQELSDLLAPEVADDIQISGSPATGTIQNDDSATVSFAEASSVVIEATGSLAIDVVLEVAGGGTLSESITVNVSDLLSGSAQTPQDYTLQTTSVTFGAGSGDNSTRQVNLVIVVDEILEEEESVRLALSLEGDGIDGAVALAAPDEHEVTITDDPMTASISGIVWVDANNNGLPDANEATIPGVVVSLEGEDLLGRTVESTTITDSLGRYSFVNLPGGTYSVVESHPDAFHDGQESLGAVEGTTAGEIGEDRFTGMVLPPAKAATDYDFGEWGLRAKYVSNRLFLTSTVADAAVLRDRVAMGEENAGDSDLARAIRYGQSVTVQRIGTEVTVAGSDSRDLIEFTPAGSKSAPDDSHHQIAINGLTFAIDKTEASEFILQGNDGYDDLTLHDSSGDDSLEASGSEIQLVNDDFTLQALAFEAILARSDSGGDDEAKEDAIDYLLRLEGAWDEP